MCNESQELLELLLLLLCSIRLWLNPVENIGSFVGTAILIYHCLPYFLVGYISFIPNLSTPLSETSIPFICSVGNFGLDMFVILLREDKLAPKLDILLLLLLCVVLWLLLLLAPWCGCQEGMVVDWKLTLVNTLLIQEMQI